MQALYDLLEMIIAIPWLSALLIALLGLCVGSFLNVVIYRLPKIMMSEWRHESAVILHDQLPEQYQVDPLNPAPRMTLSKPVSTCPSCEHKIRWYENVPLISWLVLRGKCSACKTSIGVRYPLVELLTMLASLTVFLVLGPTLQMLAALGLTWALIALTGIDFDTYYLPDQITLPLAAAGLLVNAQSLFASPSKAIWGYVVGYLALWIVNAPYKAIKGRDGIGAGDFKLLAALGAWLGVSQIIPIILISSFVGVAIGAILLVVRQANREYPFGPYIAIAGWISLLWGDQLVTSYLSLYH